MVMLFRVQKNWLKAGFNKDFCLLTTMRFYRTRQLTQNRLGVFPTGNTQTVNLRFAIIWVLIAFDQIAFNHHANNRLFTAGICWQTSAPTSICFLN